MNQQPVFTAAMPEKAAARLNRESIHVWRLPCTAAAGRAPFRALLGTYLGTPASAIALVEGTHGKPVLANQRGKRDALDFNWSHSRGQALMALARGTAVGVDIERLADGRRQLELARRFFAPTEAAALAGMEREARTHAFTGLWCAKEAVLKCVGEGLAFGLGRLAFAWRGAGDWDLQRIDPELGRMEDWHVAAFTPVPGYRGALAWRGGWRRIETWEPTAGSVPAAPELAGPVAVPQVRASLP